MMNPVTGWFANRSRRNARSAARSRRFSLGLEPLEARVVLSTYTVNSVLDANPPAGVMTLRQAIVAANNDHNTDPQHPDFIEVTMGGTIALGSALPALTGSVEIEGPGAGSLTIQGDGLDDAILSVASGASVTVSGVTLDGDTSKNSGITVAATASLTVENDVFQNCFSTTSGGGILNNGGTVSVAQSSFVGESSDAYGGSIANLGGDLTISQSTFSLNFTNFAGGAVYDAADSSGNGGELTVLASTFFNNISDRGGAIGLGPGADATVVDSTFTGNIAEFIGGAIALYGSQFNGPQIALRLSGSTVTGNTDVGIYVQPASFTQPVLLDDSIIAGNTPASGFAAGPDLVGAVDPRSSFNLIGDGTGITGLVASTNGNMIGSDANPIDPDLGPLEDNGGPTLTMAPLPGSPAIDNGGPDPVGDDYTGTDQAGNPRIVTQPGIVPPVGGDGRDIGAFELALQTPTILIVNSTADANPPAGVLTLRQALEAADGTVPLSSLPASQVEIGSPYIDEIEFSVTGTIALASPLPTIDAVANVAVEGPGASSLMIVGDGLHDAIFTVAPHASLAVASVTLAGPALINGEGNTNIGITVGADAVAGIQNAVIQDVVATNEGGAIFNQAGFVTLWGSEVQNAIAVNDGGGIATLGGSVGVSQCLFTNNVTYGDGGAIDAEGSLGGGLGTPGALTIVDSTFSDNTALGVHGGGALFLQAGTVTFITNSTFAGNSAIYAEGGAICESGVATLTLDDSTLTGNTAPAGGGIWCQLDTSPMTILQNTIVVGNVTGGNPAAPSDASGTIESASANNLFGDGSQVTIPGSDIATEAPLVNGYNGNQVGTDAQPIDADLGPLRYNGGPTPTVALLPGSPAIGTGQNGLNGVTLFTDQRGYVSAAGSPWDIGAYQSTATPDITPALSAPNVVVADYGKTTYTFRIVTTDNVDDGSINGSILTASVVTVVPPGGGSPIAAILIGTPVANGPTDPWGDAHSFTVTYEIVPPGGKWTSADNGSYFVDVNGTPLTEVAGDPAANSTVATFQVETGSIGVTKFGLTHNIRTGTWSGSVSLTNTGSSALIGPIFILFKLPPGVVLENATGTVDGMAYIELDVASLAAGATTSLTLDFNSDVSPGNYSTSYDLGSLGS